MTPRPSAPALAWAVRFAGVTPAVVGGGHFIAWMTGFIPRRSEHLAAAGVFVMKTNAALALLLAGVALLLLHQTATRGPKRWAGIAASMPVLVIGAMTLSEHLFHCDLGLDQLLASEPRGALGVVSPNRMGPAASTSFVLIGLGLLALAWRRPQPRAAAPFLGLATCGVVLVPAVGYLIGIASLYGGPRFLAIAWPTVVSVLLLGIALMLARRDCGPMAQLLREDVGGVLLRRVLPWMVAVPVALGYLRLQGERVGFYDTATGTGLLVIALLLFFSLLLWRSAAGLSRAAARHEADAQALSAAAEERGRLLENITDACVGFDRDWRYTYVNVQATQLLGMSAEELLGRNVWDLFPASRDTEIQKAHLRAMNERVSQHLDFFSPSRRCWYENHIYPSGSGVLNFWQDVTERKRAEQEREVTVDFLRLTNQTSGTRDLVKAAATFFQQQSGCETVGIRLKEGDDYPYCEARGFSKEFLLLENELCLRDEGGAVVRDSTGDPVMECMCGNVICGRVNPSKSFFSPGGSFWANDTTRLLATTMDADRQVPTRNRCNGEGYESVALIPLVVGKERLGLLQLNDRRKGMFSPEVIALWERLAGYLALALTRSRLAEELTAEKERLSVTLHSIGDAVIATDEAGRVAILNGVAEQLTGWRAAEAVGRPVGEVFHIIDEHTRQPAQSPVDHVLREGAVVGLADHTALLARDGTERPIADSAAPIWDASGRISGVVLVFRDQTEERQAKDVLRASETRYRLLFQNMLDGFAYCRMLFDERGRPEDFVYLEVNGVFERLTGLREVVGKKVSEVIPDIRESQQELLDTYGRVASTGQPERFEVDFRPLGMWLSISVYCPRQDHFVAVFNNITERKRAEEALRDSEAKLRALADSMPQLAWTAQPDGYVTWYNHRWHEYTGTTPKQMEGWGWQSVHDPVTLPDVLARWKESIASGTAFEMEFPLRGADGQFRRFLTRGFPLKDVEGKVAQWFGTNTDVTELVEAQERLALVTRLYHVLSRVNEAIVRVREEHRLYEEVCRVVADEGGFPLAWVGLVREREVALAASAGTAKDYLRDIKVEVEGELGRGPTGVCVREGRPAINDDFDHNPSTSPWREAALRHGLRASAAFPVRRQGSVIGALGLYAAKRGAFTGEHIELLESLCADVSFALDAMERDRLRSEAERALRESEGLLRLANEELRESGRRKDEFLAMLSHELRNPLAPIRNSIYILEHADPAGPQAARARAVVKRQAEHMTRLVDDLLDVTRITRGKFELRRQQVDLREVLLHAAEDYRLAMDDRGVEFRTELPHAKIWAHADATRIAQVVGNLLHNALKFTRRGGEVTLSLRALEREAAVISVRDTGIGMDPALLPKIFDAFVQGERTLARTEGGLGLGLALVKGIVELHGGAVHAESPGDGKGAQFLVQLPIEERAELGASRDAPSEGAGRKDRRRVLIVDDNADAAESLAELVEFLGHTAEIAYDGPSAIEKALANAPDVVLCDIGLPGMSGHEVARALREKKGNQMQLIAVSGYAQLEDVQNAVEAGFDGHLGKPFDAAMIERLLA